jgi:hypothetical protein
MMLVFLWRKSRKKANLSHFQKAKMMHADPSRKLADFSLWLAFGIALAAFVLRLSLINFPTDCHPDERMFAAQNARYVEQRIFTADWTGSAAWAGYESEGWGNPTLQHSPYILIHSVLARFVHWSAGWPSNLDGYIMLARVSSCFWGALAVLLVFFLGRTSFSAAASLLGEATLATCFLHVQDSIYARVDTFLCFFVLLSLVLAFQAAKRPGRYFWFAATFLSVGITLAAKYNAVPVLLLIPWIPYRWARTGAISWRRGAMLAFAGFFVTCVGFVLATPDLLWGTSSFIAGIKFQFHHYTTGRIPNQAYGWADNNLFYFVEYMVRLGFGWLPSIFALLYIIRIVVLRRWEDFLLGTFLAVAIVLYLATKVRFERNMEIFIGPLTLAAGVTACDLYSWLKSRLNVLTIRLLYVVILTIWFVQPLRAVYYLSETLDWPLKYSTNFPFPFLEQMPTIAIYGYSLEGYSIPEALQYPQILMAEYGDPFSMEAAAQLRQLYGSDPKYEIRSPWCEHGYPFSSVDIYHGPRKVYIYIKNDKSKEEK